MTYQLSNDIIKYKVYPYLSIRDKILLNLSGVKPKFDINLEFNHCIKLRLEKLGLTKDTIDTLLEKIKKENLVMAGSFILQCIYNETYNDSPTKEIKINSCQFETFEGYSNYRYSEYLRKVNTRYDQYLKQSKNAVDINIIAGPSSQMQYLYESECFEVTETRLEILMPVAWQTYCFKDKILFNQINIKNPIFDCFYGTNKKDTLRSNAMKSLISKIFEQDLDFCKCTYDGEKLRIYDVQSVINKKTLYDFDKIINEITLSKLAKKSTQCEIETILLKRIDKYKNRGYTINITKISHDKISNRDKKIIDERRNEWLESFDYILKTNKTYSDFSHTIKHSLTPDMHKHLYLSTDFITKSKQILYKIYNMAIDIYNDRVSANQLYSDVVLFNDYDMKLLTKELFTSYKN